MTSAWGVLVFTLPTLAIAALAGLGAAWRTPTPGQTAVVQHLAAGIVFAATALELLPKERTEAAVPVILGFALGIGLMLAMRSFARTMEKRNERRRLPYGMLTVTALDLLIDGLVLGMAFAAGEKTGLLLTIALTLEVLFLALSVSASLANSGASRWLTALVPASLAVILSLGAVAGRLFFGSLAPFPFAVLLGIGIVALLYLVTEELLVEAHEVKETPIAVSAFFVGFLIFLVIEILVEAR